MDPYQQFLFWVFGGLTSACAIATVVTHNIVRAATWLLFTLAGTSGLFFLIGADLVGAVQLLVYVGGTMVLVVFGVMLTAQGPFVTMRTSSAGWAVSAATGIVLFALLVLSFTSKSTWKPNPDEPVVKYAPPAKELGSGEISKTSNTMVIGQGFAGVPVGPAHRDPNRGPHPIVESKPDDAKPKPKLMKIDDHGAKDKDDKHEAAPKAETPVAGGVIRMNYLLPFEIVSVHLLVVLIAAAYLARAKRWEGKS